MNIAISGFTNSPDIKKFLETNFNISEIVDNDVKFLLTKNNIDDIQYKSSKIKQAIMKNVPIICFEDLKDINQLKKLIN